MTAAARLSEAVIPSFPRLWLGPADEVIDCTAADRSHAATVAEDPGKFGIDPADMRRLVAFWDDHDFEFDYEYVIARAEANGWVRTSTDGANHNVSGASIPAVHRAMRWLADRGYLHDGAEIELERIVGSMIESQYYQLDMAQVDRFLRLRRLPAAKHTGSIPLEWQTD